MEFYAPNGMKRPVRLCESTRKFAFDSLDRKYGKDTLKTEAVCLDDVDGYEQMTKLEQYDIAIERIVKEAPIRICPDEMLSGAATLGLAIRHRVPAVYRDKKAFGSVSHLTIDFKGVLHEGVDAIRARTEASLLEYAGSDREPFLRSCLHCLDCFDIWHKRYLDALSGMPEYAENYKNLQRVPHKPATNFYEAVQSIWFIFAFSRLCGNWPGIGRIDLLLGDYLKRDLESGCLTLDEAREILAHLFIKGCEWITGGWQDGSGDAQHYQNILLCGVDENGKEVTNEVTYLVLDVLEELGIGDFPTSVRVNENTDPALLRRVAEVMRYGGGILAVYGEPTVIKAMIDYGYTLSEARQFANDGCWEVQVPGKTYFAYVPFDSLRVLQQKTLRGYAESLDYPDFESLYHAYLTDLGEAIEEQVWGARAANRFRGEVGSEEAKLWKMQTPCTVVSLFERGCIEKGLSYLEGGPVYNVLSPHIGGLADTVNSLYAIKKLVYDEKKMDLNAFVSILASDWEGEESLRQYVRNRYSYYGNDNDESDAIYARLLHDFSQYCKCLEGRCGFAFPPGVSTFGRQLEWAPHRLASPHGRRAHEVLAANTSPTPGSDSEGATAIVRSYCKADLSRLPTGAALDLKLLPSAVAGEDGLDALVALMQGFVTLGGFFMQPDVVDTAVLHDAQEHPEEYSTLSVRVSGWNARFVTLCREWQDMVIAQNEK